MFSAIDSSTLAIVLTAIVAVALVFGAVLNAITRENGFGPTGNAVLFAAGFLGAAYIAHMQGISPRDLKMMAAYGLGGAFALFSALALLKAGLARR